MLTLLSGSCLALSNGGCQTPLGLKQAEVIRAWGKGNDAYERVATAHAAAADDVVRQVLDQQRAMVTAEFDRWLATHTGDDGRLGSVAADGSIVPMRAEQITEAIAARDRKLGELAVSGAKWKQISATMSAANTAFVKMNAATLATNEEIAAAEASAQQFMESALTALGSFAAGALAVP